ncbi:MAG: DUF1819 family protein, partial [Caldilineaceae bacterium]|nr:DUF1819 family protein [Caldilineaceae bacterium]
NASKRIYREISSRLRLLTADELTLLCAGSRHDQLYLLWLAVCKRYRFIRLFAEQVLREKFLRLDMVITYADYDRFFYQMADVYPEVDGVAQRTQMKQRQVIFKMMREADLITDKGLILPAILSPALIERIHHDNPEYFAIYPVAEADVQIYNTQHESR